MTTGSTVKRLLFFFVFAFLFGLHYTAKAQNDDPWIGTWTSVSYKDVDWDKFTDEYEEIIFARFKRIIRITLNGNQYQVRSKFIKLGDPDYVAYARPIQVIKVEGNTMWLESYLEKDPFYVNDKVDSYSDITYRMKLTLNNGVLHYSFYEYYTQDYNNRMNYTGSRTVKVKVTDGDELDLFKDDW